MQLPLSGHTWANVANRRKSAEEAGYGQLESRWFRHESSVTTLNVAAGVWKLKLYLAVNSSIEKRGQSI